MSGRRDEDRLREAFEALREASPEPPPFRALWARAAAGRERRRGLLRPALATLAVALAALAVAVVVVRGPGPRPDAVEVDAVELARSLSAWEAPLDFLLEGPADELWGAPARLEPLRRALPELPESLEFQDLSREETI